MSTYSNTEASRLRRTAFQVAYRILGQAADADDVAQDAVTRVILADNQPDRPDAYAAKAAARLSLNVLRNRRSRERLTVGEDLPAPLAFEEAGAETRLDLSYGLMVITMNLPPLSRAVFVLRNAFGLSFRDIAAALGRSEDGCRQAHRRATLQLAEYRPPQPEERSQAKRMMQRLVDMVGAGDIDGLATILTDTVVLHSDGGGRAPAFSKPIDGVDRIARFLSVSPALVDAQAVARVADTVQGPMILIEVDDHPVVTILAELAGDRINRLYAISHPEKLVPVRTLSED